MLGSAALALGSVALPAIALARRRWLRGLTERLGAGRTLDGAPIWIHAASVGEVRVASPLVRGLRALDLPVALSTTTISGRDLARLEMPETPSFLAPLDHWMPVRRTLRRIRPRALVLVETELWPEMLTSSLTASIPVALVNGRISDRTYRRYARMRRWLSPMLGRLTAVLARSEVDRERLIELGCRPEVCLEPGELKAASMAMPSARTLRSQPPFVLVAGSLHATELAPWVGLLRRTRDLPLAHVLAPRHLERLGELRGALEAAGIEHEMWSRHRPNFPDPAGKVLVVDTVGDLASLYASGDLAFVGGSLDAGAAGHNLMEPATFGRMVLFGPGVSSQKAAAHELAEAGAAVPVGSVDELEQAIRGLLAEPSELERRGRLAYEVATRNHERGQRTLQRAITLIEALT